MIIEVQNVIFFMIKAFCNEITYAYFVALLQKLNVTFDNSDHI